MGQALRKEIETYQENLPSLSSEEGKFALVHKDSVVGVFDSYQDALKVGYETFGLDPILVKQISTVESVAYFTRELT